MAAGLAANARGDGGGEEMSCGGNVDVLLTIFYVNVDPTSGLDTLGQAGLRRRRFLDCVRSHIAVQVNLEVVQLQLAAITDTLAQRVRPRRRNKAVTPTPTLWTLVTTTSLRHR